MKTVNGASDCIHFSWKVAAIQGMTFVPENILLRNAYQFTLEEIDGHIAHSSENAFFIAGASAVFKSLQIKLDEQDNALLLNYIKTGRISRFGHLYEVP